MDRITRFSLKNATVVVIASLLVTFGGMYTANELNKESMPDVAIPIVAVVTPYPGAAPTDVYEKVTQPLERAISGVPGMEGMSGTSADSVSVVVAEFDYDKDMDEAEAEILKVIDDVELPENTFDTEIVRISFGSQPIVKLTITGGGSADELQALVRETIAPAIGSVDGVGEVDISADQAGVVRIVFDAEALEERGLTAQGVMQQLQATNLSFPVGSVVVDGLEEPIRVSGTIETVEDIKALDIAIYPNMNAVYGDALAQLGAGIGELGSAVGQIGGAVGQLGSAVGQLGEGMGDLAEGLGTQIGLVAALQGTEADLLDAKIALAQANTTLLDPAATPDEIAIAQGTIAQMSAVIPALEGAVAGIESQLAAAQSAAMAGGTSMPSAPSGFGVSSMPTAEGSEESTIAIELVELGELAEVTFDTSAESDRSRFNGEAAVLVNVVQSQDANTVEVSELVQAELDDLQTELPSGIDMKVTYDAAEAINESIWDMVREGLMGAFFAFLVILFFLRNWRSTLLAVISIPLSVVAALMLLGQFDVTLNMMTLGGLTVAIGRIVDDSIVVIENIYRHLQLGEEKTSGLIRLATKEVSSAITSSTLTTVAVFAPMAMVSGIVGKIFLPFALTVALALMASLLVALAVVPLMAKWLLLKSKVPQLDEKTVKTDSTYAKLLSWALDHRKSVVAGAVVVFVGSLALIPIIGVGFMPPATEPYANVDVSYPAGTTADTVDAALAEIEDTLAGVEEVEYYQTTVGAASGFDIASGSNQGTVFVKFDEESDIDSLVRDLRDSTEHLKDDGARITVSRVDVTMAGANSVDIIITGPDFNEISATAEELAAVIEDIEGLENVASNVSAARPQITVDVDQVKAAEYGLNAAMVAGTVRSYIAQDTAGSIDVDGHSASIEYSVASEEIASAEDVAAIKLATPLGDSVAIGDVAHVEETATPVSVLTLDERRFAGVSASVTERDSNTVIKEIQSEIDQLDLAEGVEIKISGMAEMMADSFQQLALAMIIAVFAVYLVMVIAFGEAVAPLAIMMSLPLAIIGGILGLFFMGIPLDMPSMIGALMLIGIVTTNAIVLIDRVMQKLREGLSRRDALIEAGAERIRPILMTALTTIMALIPMASGMYGGGLMSQSLAVIVVGGLTTSTGLTLIVVPVVYDLLERMKERIIGEKAVAAAYVDMD